MGASVPHPTALRNGTFDLYPLDNDTLQDQVYLVRLPVLGPIPAYTDQYYVLEYRKRARVGKNLEIRPGVYLYLAERYMSDPPVAYILKTQEDSTTVASITPLSTMTPTVVEPSGLTVEVRDVNDQFARVAVTVPSISAVFQVDPNIQQALPLTGTNTALNVTLPGGALDPAQGSQTITLAQLSRTDAQVDLGLGGGPMVILGAYAITVSGTLVGDTPLNCPPGAEMVLTAQGYPTQISAGIYERVAGEWTLVTQPGDATGTRDALVRSTYDCCAAGTGPCSFGCDSANSIRCCPAGSAWDYTARATVCHLSNWGLGYQPQRAVVDVHPKTLNRQSGGQYITVYLELPEAEPGETVADVDVATIALDVLQPRLSTHAEDEQGRPVGEVREPALGIPVASTAPTEVGDEDDDGEPDRMVKFDRTTVEAGIPADGKVTLRIRGRFHAGKWFTGEDSIIVVSNPQ